MIVVAQGYRDWLAGFSKEPPERMGLALAAVEAFEHCHNRSQTTGKDLAPLVTAACSPHKLVFETGCNLLARLARSVAEARKCFLRMSEDQCATARFHAVAYLDRTLPEELRLESEKFAKQEIARLRDKRP